MKLQGLVLLAALLASVVSQRAALAADPFTVYRALRHVNPSPYMYFLRVGSRSIVGSSPEMLVRVEGSRVETHPIAGTRPRGRSVDEDQRLAEEAADVLYHLAVLLRSRGLSLADAEEVLLARRR